MNNLIKVLGLLIFSLLIITNCASDDKVTATNKNTSFTDDVDRAFFKQIKGFADIYDKKEIISNFKFGQYPMYFIQTVGDDGIAGTGNAIKGFVINPLSKIEGSKKLSGNESFGLNIYRLDHPMKEAEKKIKIWKRFIRVYFQN